LARIQKAVYKIDKAILLWEKMKLTARVLAGAVGSITSATPSMQAGMLVRVAMEPLRRRRSKYLWDAKVEITWKAVTMLVYIRSRIVANEGRFYLPPEGMVNLFTDASSHGWGIFKTKGIDKQQLWGIFDEFEEEYHINMKELYTTAIVLEDPLVDFLELRGQCVKPWIDNTPALSYIKRGGGRFCHMERISIRFYERA
jgi:hypothetical protein